MFTGHHRRYDDYFLVNERDMEEYFVEEPHQKCCCKAKKRTYMIIFLVFLGLLLFLFLLAFVVFPLIFKYDRSIQQSLVFTRFGLPTKQEIFDDIWFPGFKNRHVPILTSDTSNRTLGVYQILPTNLTYLALSDPNFDYDLALRHENFSVLLYFHGTGETRADFTNQRKYQILRFFFHIISFDYRGYGDSTDGFLSENSVVSDCVELYKWIKTKTDAPIYIWGHSLGSAIATHTLKVLERENNNATGLVLESAFTTLADEIYEHPITKFFAWLPWFYDTIISPLKKNGFIFDNVSNIKTINCPVMFLHSRDDDIVPYRMSEELYGIASDRNTSGTSTVLHIYNETLRYGHIYMYVDPYLPYYILDFKKLCEGDNVTTLFKNVEDLIGRKENL